MHPSPEPYCLPHRPEQDHGSTEPGVCLAPLPDKALQTAETWVSVEKARCSHSTLFLPPWRWAASRTCREAPGSALESPLVSVLTCGPLEGKDCVITSACPPASAQVWPIGSAARWGEPCSPGPGLVCCSVWTVSEARSSQHIPSTFPAMPFSSSFLTSGMEGEFMTPLDA